MKKLSRKTTKALFKKDSRSMKAVVWCLIVVAIVSSLAAFTLAAGDNDQKYNLTEISLAAANVWTQKTNTTGGEEGEGEAQAQNNSDIAQQIRRSGDIYVAANFLGYNPSHMLASDNSKNSMTITYESLKNSGSDGAYGYAVYGHMLNSLGYDTIVQTSASSNDGSATPSARRLQGVFLLGSYFAHKSYTTIMNFTLEGLQKLNVFRYLYEYAQKVTDEDVELNGSYTYEYTPYNYRGRAGSHVPATGTTTDMQVHEDSYNSATGQGSGFITVDGQTTNIRDVQVTLSADPDSPGLFKKAMQYIARIYSILFNMGWTIVLPFLFVVLGVVFMMYTRNASKGRPSNTLWPHIKKIIIYILWLTLIIPGIATLYTTALDSMVKSNAQTNAALADNVILSTLVDFRTWSTTGGLNWNDVALTGSTKSFIDLDTSENPSGIITPEGYFAVRDRAYNLNLNLGLGSATNLGSTSVFGTNMDTYLGLSTNSNGDTVFGSADTTFDMNGDPVITALLGQTTKPKPTNATYSDSSQVVSLILSYLTNETVNAASVASTQQSILNSGSYGEDGDLDKYWEAAVNPDTYGATATEGGDSDSEAFTLHEYGGRYGIGSNGGFMANDVFTHYNGTNQALLSYAPFEFNNNQFEIKSDLITTIIDQHNSTARARGFSALGLYNYMSTDFSNEGSITVYNNAEGRNVTTNVNHYAVSAVGNGALRWLYIMEACLFMLTCSIIGIFYCLSMFASTMKHSLQAMLALIKGIMSDLTSMVKAVVLAFWMCIDVIFTVSFYKIITELLLGMSALFNNLLLKAIMGNDKFADTLNNYSATSGSQIIIILGTAIKCVALLAVIVIAIKLRKNFIKSATEIFEVIVDRITGAKSSVSQQGTPYADAAKHALSNFGTMALVGAQNTGHAIATGNVGGIISNAWRPAAAAGLFGLGSKILTDTGTLDNLAQGAASAIDGSINTMDANMAEAAAGSGAGVTNQTDVNYNDSDQSSYNSQGTPTQYNEDVAESFAQNVTQAQENGQINSSNTLEQNSEAVTNAANSAVNGTNNYNENGTTDSSYADNSSNADSYSSDSGKGNTPVKGAAGPKSQNGVYGKSGVNEYSVQNSNQTQTSVQNSDSKNNMQSNQNVQSSSTQTMSANANTDNKSSQTNNVSNKDNSARNNIVKQNESITTRNAAAGRVRTNDGQQGRTLQAASSAAAPTNPNRVTNGSRSVEVSSQIKAGSKAGMVGGANGATRQMASVKPMSSVDRNPATVKSNSSKNLTSQGGTRQTMTPNRSANTPNGMGVRQSNLPNGQTQRTHASSSSSRTVTPNSPMQARQMQGGTQMQGRTTTPVSQTTNPVRQTMTPAQSNRPVSSDVSRRTMPSAQNNNKAMSGSTRQTMPANRSAGRTPVRQTMAPVKATKNVTPTGKTEDQMRISSKPVSAPTTKTAIQTKKPLKTNRRNNANGMK